MDRKTILKLLVGSMLILAITFLPLINVENVPINLVDCMSKNGFDWVSVPFLLTILTFACIVLNFLFIEKVKIFYPSFFLAIFNIVFMFMIPYFYAIKCGLDIYSLNFIFFYPFPFAICISFVCFVFYLSKIFSGLKFTIKDIAEIGVYVALALVLDIGIFKIRIGASGGSISFSMLPLIVLVLRKGFSKGFLACGFVFGFISCLIDGYGLFTFPFDYLFGFGSLAIVGLFNDLIRNNNGFKRYLFLVSSILIAGVSRIMASTISGMIFYGVDFVGSLVYQLLYIPASIGACTIVICVLYTPISKILKRYSF